VPDDAAPPPADAVVHEGPPPHPPPRRRRSWPIVVGLAVVIAILFAVGALPRLAERRAVRRHTADLAVPYVSVVRAQREASAQQVTLPGNVQALISAPIFARVSGYLDRWYVDIGAHVEEGQLLALIAIPEVVQQLEVARGTLQVSEANLRLSQETAKRFTDLRSTRAVSQQDVDNAIGALEANKATVAANTASVRQLEQLVEFSKIRAPFSGVISARNVDIGDLINAGSSTTPGTSLFELVQPDFLRVYVNVPEPFAPLIRPGLLAELDLLAFPGKRFPGTLVRTARAIDPTTRTLLAEILVFNPTRVLYAGSFAEVTFSVPATQASLMVPVEALIFRGQGLQVATVRDGKAVLKTVTPGRDFGDRIEITHGLTADDLVITNPPDSLTEGEPLRIAAGGGQGGAPTSPSK